MKESQKEFSGIVEGTSTETPGRIPDAFPGRMMELYEKKIEWNHRKTFGAIRVITSVEPQDELLGKSLQQSHKKSWKYSRMNS